ncbi:MAG: repeat containing protein, partial [Herbinix sp.]|nr:repeat containing protein [Herbinix sp.]
GITYHNGDIFVSHRGKITVIRPDGSKEDALSGLPSFGDHQNNQVVFGADGKMYFGQGTATNSGVVGLDNTWIMQHPQFHDYAGTRITLNGCNFITDNIFTEAKDYAYTAAFSPFGEPNFYPNEEIRGYIKASGSILRANPDGSALEQVVWGLRNPFRLKFDISNRLFSTNLGADVRGSRPIANCVDEFQMIQSGIWYGWPDYNGGLPVTLPEFTPEGGPPLTLLINTLPNIPPKPFAVFQPHSTIMGFDFNYNPDFDNYGDAYVAEFGSEAPFTTGGKPDPNVGHKVTRIDMTSGTVSDFAVNKSGLAAFESGSGGFERPSDVVFGPDGAMYVLDFGVSKPGEPGQYYKGSGVIWRIARIS